MNKPKIAVAILGYNDESNIDDVVLSCLDQEYTNYHIFYIDNNSKDNSLETVKKYSKKITITAFDKNYGYAGAYQKIIKRIFKEKYDAVVLLNSDTIVKKSWLSELVKSAYKSNKIGIAQSKILLHQNNNKTNKINSFGNKINYLGFGYCDHYNKNDSKKTNKDIQISSASGCSMLIKRDAYERIGGIDQNFFAYLEDQDMSFRALMNGYQIVASAKSVVWHKYSFEPNKRNNWKYKMFERNRLIFIYKNYTNKLILLFMPMFMLIELGVIYDSLRRGYFFDKIASYKEFIILKKKYIKYRKRTLKEHGKIIEEVFKKNTVGTIEYEQEITSILLKLSNRVFSFYYSIMKFFL